MNVCNSKSEHDGCAHDDVECLNPYEPVRKFRCRDCDGVMMCACDREFGEEYLPHQLSQGQEYATKREVPVTHGFQAEVCRTCRGLQSVGHPKAELPGSTSKYQRYYWREIYKQTVLRFGYWCKQHGYDDWIAARHDPVTSAAYKWIHEDVKAFYRAAHKHFPKYDYSDEPSQQEVIDAHDVTIVDREVEYVESGGRAKIQSPNGPVSVEQYAARCYREQGFEVILCESRPIHVLFGTFMCLEIDSAADPLAQLAGFSRPVRMDAPDEERHYIEMYLPQDFGAREFAENRRERLDRHFDEIRESAQDILWLFDYWLEVSARLRMYLWAYADHDVEAARQLVAVLPNAQLISILKYLVEDYWGRYCGWPDLFVFSDHNYKFVEVKSSNDSLSLDQKDWIAGNAKFMQLPFEMLKLHRAKPE
ncbi:VRR-NUC domain-containing protein [Persicimonas caeni]|uniref:VRR-NUC domain-containing protein n=1 Tax=Persicimonas caeni TaxID=2292766 RepID=A0A4Y6PQT0_PERCE|nr:VRR-NUC domain-containing protein [Persicimonas caeni]QDG50583.1 VRR-NUC domain-containing protein [Persicimonas caeni]QED31804.1 VRR-NUC domain-containing protein [Persicimonas caeni]